MGFTRYWEKTKETSEQDWKVFTEQFERLIDNLPNKTETAGGYHADDPLIIADGMGKHKGAVIDGESIMFNGYGELAHETFSIHRTDTNGFNFCKTARKPYDVLVLATLILADTMGIIDNFSGDSDEEDDVQGQELFNKVMLNETEEPETTEYIPDEFSDVRKRLLEALQRETSVIDPEDAESLLDDVIMPVIRGEEVEFQPF